MEVSSFLCRRKYTRHRWIVEIHVEYSRFPSKKSLYSDNFIAGGCKWRLLLDPKGNNVDYLSMYLDVADSSCLPKGWSREVESIFALVNQFDTPATVTKEFRHVFCAESKSWGSPYFTPLSKIKSAAERFLVNDNLTVEATVVVLGAVHYSTAYKPNKLSEPEPNKATEATVGAPVVPGIPVKVEPLHHSTGASEQTPLTSDQEHNVPATEGTQIHSKDEALVQIASKRLLTELSTRRKKHKPIFSNEILGSSRAPESAADFQQQQKEALRVFFDMPFEAIQQANCFLKIEGCLQELVQHTNDLQERTVFEDIISRLANFKRSIDNAKEIAEAAEARRSSLAGKSANLDSKLEQRQKDLSSLESDFSMLSEEEAQLRAEIDRVIAQKKSVSVKLERANEETCKEIEEWRSLEAEMKKVNAEWVGAKEKLASANVHWDLLREDLGF